MLNSILVQQLLGFWVTFASQFTTMVYIIRSLVTVALLILIDYYAFQAWKTATKPYDGLKWIFWLASGLAYAMMLASLILVLNGTRNADIFHTTMTIMLALYVPKLFVVFVLMGEDLWRLGEGVWMKFSSSSSSESFLPSRRKFVSQLAFGLASIPFLGIIYGSLYGKYKFRVNRQNLYFDDLPPAFDGFKIAQLSDLHVGSFDSKEEVLRGLEMLNAEKPDVTLFTGDLVNNEAVEMDGWFDVFSQIKSKIGNFSILGNHDYGDYVIWGSAREKRENFAQVVAAHEKIGFQLLRNEAVELKRGEEAIYISGVENWGKPPFPQYGDLDAATEKIPEGGFTVLMSHDPSHFDEQVKNHKANIPLTLSGHTHGMQFGIEIPGFIRWSPVKYRYPKWAGLYQEKNRYLYVNRGFGHIGYRGRVGIWPEITIITLKKKTA
jgi:predicted MPP superfamily phosphohydrolase